MPLEEAHHTVSVDDAEDPKILLLPPKLPLVQREFTLEGAEVCRYGCHTETVGGFDARLQAFPNPLDATEEFRSPGHERENRFDPEAARPLDEARHLAVVERLNDEECVDLPDADFPRVAGAYEPLDVGECAGVVGVHPYFRVSFRVAGVERE